MPTYTGRLEYAETAAGMSAKLTTPNPSPPPPKLTVWSCDEVPDWLKPAIRAHARTDVKIDAPSPTGAPTMVTVD